MDINDLRTVSTVLAFVAFAGLVVWAFSSSRKHAMEEIGRSPLDDDDSVTGDTRAGIKHN